MNWTHVAIVLAVNAYLLGGLTAAGVCVRIARRDWQIMRLRHPGNSARVELTCAVGAGLIAVLCWPYFAWQWWGPRK